MRRWIGLLGLAGMGLAGASGCLASTLPTATNDKEPGEIPTHRLGGDGRAQPGDAPEISRSGGVPGGFVLMWPRMIPKDDPELHDLAGKVQERLKALAHATLPDAPLELRPEPERVCAQAGCEGVSVGAVLTKRERGCALVVVVGPPGPNTTLKLVPWLGVIKQKGDPPFREPPESFITIQEYGDCNKLADDLAKGGAIGDDGPISAALKDAMHASK
ncbi:MAG: hypothetical protein U0414_43950 [Polyangiaceae bacterium]